MKNSKSFWAWVGVVVVVAVIATWLVWIWAPKKPAGPQPVIAPQGQLTPQFPKNLILDSNAAIAGSYSVNFSTSTNQYTANYTSSSTMKTLYGEYQSYFPANGWTVTGSLTTHPTFEMIVATQGGAQVQVVISTEPKGSAVAVTYVTSQ